MSRTSKSLTATGETLAGIDVFRDLSAEERRVIAKCCQYRRYQPPQAVLGYRERSRDVFFIVSGRAQAIIYSQAGKQVTLQDMASGQMFGELSAIDGKPRSAYVIATAETYVASMRSDDFNQVLQHHPAVARATLQRLVNMVRYLSERVFEISALSVRQRIHAEVLRLALANSDDARSALIAPAPTHIDIAQHIGTHREAVSREFTQLSNAGLIQRQRQALLVCDIPRLTHMVHSPPD